SSPSSENGAVPRRARTRSKASGNSRRLAWVNAAVAQPNVRCRRATATRTPASTSVTSGPPAFPQSQSAWETGTVGSTRWKPIRAGVPVSQKTARCPSSCTSMASAESTTTAAARRRTVTEGGRRPAPRIAPGRRAGTSPGAEVLDEDHRADPDEQQPTEGVQPAAEHRPGTATDEQPHRAEDRGGDADGGDGERERRIEHRERDADRERIDARRHREKEHDAKSEQVVLAPRRRGLRAPGFPEHLR